MKHKAKNFNDNLYNDVKINKMKFAIIKTHIFIFFEKLLH